jgi:hypothetical protein
MKLVPVRQVEKGSIIRLAGDWGVLEGRVLDRWVGGPIRIKGTELVEVLPPSKLRRERKR